MRSRALLAVLCATVLLCATTAAPTTSRPALAELAQLQASGAGRPELLAALERALGLASADPRPALAALNAALALEPAIAIMHDTRCALMHQIGADARACYGLAIALEPRDALVHARSALYQLSRRPGGAARREAFQSLEAALAIDPGLAMAHHARAELLQRLSRELGAEPWESLSSFERALGPSARAPPNARPGRPSCPEFVRYRCIAQVTAGMG